MASSWQRIASIAAAAVVVLSSSPVAAADQVPFGFGFEPDLNSPTHSESKENPFNDEFADFAKETLEKFRVPGVSIAVIDGEDVYAEGYGFATLPDTPATPDTIWFGASTTKAQTAATLSYLINTGNYTQLSDGWTTPISSIIREDFVLQDDWATAHLTLDDAVSHRTGMPRHDKSTMSKIDGRWVRPRDIVRNLRNLALTYKPRVEFRYCNLMYITLSHVIETLTGKWLGDVMKEVLWDPLGMNSTFMDLDEALAAPNHLAHGYAWIEERGAFVEADYMPLIEVSGAGAVMSTALDYAKWVKCLLHESAPLPEAVHKDIRAPRMLSTTTPSSGLDVLLYGLGWDRTLFRGEVLYTHDGGANAFGAEVYWFPERKYGVVAFANTALTSNAVGEALGWRLIQDRLGIPRGQQYDFAGHWEKKIEGIMENSDKAVEVLYPNAPEPSIPPTVNITRCQGTYHDAGYGTITLREEADPKNPDRTYLIAERPESTWRYNMKFRHVSGEHWVLNLDVEQTPYQKDFTRAWFKAAVDGTVESVVVEWTTRSGDLYEGITEFQRIE